MSGAPKLGVLGSGGAGGLGSGTDLLSTMGAMGRHSRAAAEGPIAGARCPAASFVHSAGAIAPTLAPIAFDHRDRDCPRPGTQRGQRPGLDPAQQQRTAASRPVHKPRSIQRIAGQRSDGRPTTTRAAGRRQQPQLCACRPARSSCCCCWRRWRSWRLWRAPTSLTWCAGGGGGAGGGRVGLHWVLRSRSRSVRARQWGPSSRGQPTSPSKRHPGVALAAGSGQPHTPLAPHAAAATNRRTRAAVGGPPARLHPPPAAVALPSHSSRCSRPSASWRT